MNKSWSFISIILLFLIGGTIFLSISSSISLNSVYAEETSNSGNSKEQQIINFATKTHNGGLWASIKNLFVPSKLTIKSDNFFGKTVENIADTVKTSTDFFKKDENLLYLNSDICKPIDFIDISGYKYEKSIINLAKKCIVKGTIKRNTFYPNNLVRRADFLTMCSKSYQKYFIDITKGLNIVYFDDVKVGSKLFQIVQASNYMGIIDLLIGKNKKRLGLDKFVTKSDVIRIMTLLNAVKPIIKTDGLNILFVNRNGYIKRGELAYVIDKSLSQDLSIDNNTKKETDNLKEYPGLKSLVQLGILNKDDFIVKNPEYAITRKQFLTLLVRTKSTLNPSIPISVPNMNYFVDVKEGTGNSVLTQAKNLGLTSFFEEKVRGKLYLRPNKFVSQYEASVVINQVAFKKLDIDKNLDNVFVTNEKIAQMILIAFDLKKEYDFNVEKKIELGDIFSVVKGWFWKE